MYEDRTHNYDPEIHEDYLIYDDDTLLPCHIVCSSVQIQHRR